MGYYNVIASCYVPGKGHYVNLPSQPIEVDDETAAPLVEAGSLVLYRPGVVPGKFLNDAIAAVVAHDPELQKLVEPVDGPIHPVEPPVAEVPDDEADPKPTRRPRSRRRTGDSDGEAD